MFDHCLESEAVSENKTEEGKEDHEYEVGDEEIVPGVAVVVPQCSGVVHTTGRVNLSSTLPGSYSQSHIFLSGFSDVKTCDNIKPSAMI